MPQAEARIELAAITSNVSRLASRTSADVMAIVKADGYGHGAVPAARAALAGGASWLGVCTPREALELRAAGIAAPLLAWLYAPDTPLEPLLRANVDVSVASIPHLTHVIAAAQGSGSTARVHLKLDTGLARGGAVGSDWPELVTAAARAQADNAISVVGVWSHFACADESGHSSIEAQLVNFEEGLELAESMGVRPQLRHIANSAATLTLPRAHYDLVRAGIAMYGLSPFPGRAKEFGLRPAMTLRAQVLLTKRVSGGSGVSYGHTYHTAHETTLAQIGLGYADGVARSASNRGPVLLGGKRRTIAGRVCMDQFMLDIGDDTIAPGEYAVLFGPGDDGEPTAEDWAQLLETISYEVVTRVGDRVERIYQ